MIGLITINVGKLREDIRKEWESVKLHDILFLLSIEATIPIDEKPNNNLVFPDRYGLKYIRGCEVLQIYDHFNNIIGQEILKDGELPQDNPDDKNPLKTKARRVILDDKYEKRSFLVALDAHQYYSDLLHDLEELYENKEKFNILLRRKPKENNFKGILETIRSLMKQNENLIIPEWFHDVFLGYGDPNAKSAFSPSDEIDFQDTFLDVDHIVESLSPNQLKIYDSNKNLLFNSQSSGELTGNRNEIIEKISEENKNNNKKKYFTKATYTEANEIQLNLYECENKLDLIDRPMKTNKVRFTAKQVEGIISGIKKGLTVIVGPPGTGKTDVAVQIVNLLYHNFPNQRTLLITHSNQALNQLFEKIAHLNIEERHLLRLGKSSILFPLLFLPFPLSTPFPSICISYGKTNILF